MKTYKEFLEEAVAASLVKMVARAAMQRNMLRASARRAANPTSAVSAGTQQAQRTASATTSSKPRRISLGNVVYHGTTLPASRAIDKTGWKTNVNVTRQMTGKGIYVTPQRRAASMYAGQRAAQRGEEPAIRTLRIPSNLYQKAKEARQARKEWTFKKGGRRFNALQMSPQAANQFDISNKPAGNIYRLDLSPEDKLDLSTRVSTALRTPRSIEILKQEIKNRRIGRIPSQKPTQSTNTPPPVPTQYRVEKLR